MTVQPATDTDNEKLIGSLFFSYAGHKIGTAKLFSTETKTEVYPFHNLKEEEGNSDAKYMRIDIRQIVLVAAGGVLSLALLIFLIRKLSDLSVKRDRKKAQIEANKPKYRIINDNSPGPKKGF